MPSTYVFLAALTLATTAAAGPRIDVIVPSDAPRLEKFAAAELADQLRRLFDADVHIGDKPTPQSLHTIYVGSPATSPHVKAAAGERWPKLTDQGHVVKSVTHDDRPVLLVGGGSPVATLWAVYELGYRFGIRYLPFGDVMPADKPKLKLDGFDVVLEPEVKTRAFVTIGKEMIGFEAWGLADYKTLLRQLAKLKFNRVILEFHPWQPFIHYEFRGVKKQTGVLAYGRRFPVDGDTAGKTAFGTATVFENPDFAGKTTYEERTKAGIGLARGIIDAAHTLGMSAVVEPHVRMVFPKEFGSVVPNARSIDRTFGLAVELPREPENKALLADLISVQEQAYRATFPDTVNSPGRQVAAMQLGNRSVGVLPQLRTSESLPLTQGEGIALSSVVPGDIGPTLHYISRASFDRKVSLESAYNDLVTASCGEGVAERSTKAFRLLEEVATLLDRDAPNVGAPNPDVLTRHYKTTNGPPAWLPKARDLYTKSYEDILRAGQRSKAGPGSWLFHVSKRQEFALAYLDCIEALCLAGQAKAKKESAKEIEQLEKAVEAIYNGLTAYSEVARDPSDRGVIAVLNEFGYRPLKQLLEEAEKAGKK